jgi:hypothetical protein
VPDPIRLCFSAITRRAPSSLLIQSLGDLSRCSLIPPTKETELDVSRRTRAERLTIPLAREVVKDLAVEHGACIRPVQLRRTNLDTGAVEQVLVPCGHTLAAVCPACAQRAKTLRAAQCREGWHLEAEPVIEGAGQQRGLGTPSHSAGGRGDPRYQRAFPAPADRRTADRVRQSRPSRSHPRIGAG